MVTAIDLSPERFRYLKSVIREGEAVFFIVGCALAEIKQNKLYELDKHKTFEDFCATQYGWTKRYCNRLIVDADVIRMLPDKMAKLVQSETAARALSKVPALLRPAVVAQAAVASAGKPVSGTQIRRAAPVPPPPPVKARPVPVPAANKNATMTKPGPKPDVLRDDTGLPVPDGIQPLWKRGVGEGEVSEMLIYLGGVRTTLRKRQKERDPLYRTVNFDSALAALGQAIADVECARPYAVCPTCQGKVPENCGACGGTGIVSEFFWKTSVTEQDKAMRVKLVKNG
jgi:hypothetical protein